jgi:hypothetical protein
MINFSTYVKLSKLCCLCVLFRVFELPLKSTKTLDYKTTFRFILIVFGHKMHKTDEKKH